MFSEISTLLLYIPGSNNVQLKKIIQNSGWDFQG